MRDNFVSTTNVRVLMEAVVELDQRGAPEACFLVVEGKPGLGKTAAVLRLSVLYGCSYVRAKVGWSKFGMLEEFCRALGLPPPRSYREAFSQLSAAFRNKL